MPHGSVRVGDIEVTALCDVVAEPGSPVTETFPDTAEAALREFPETVGVDGGWRPHDHCFLVRAPDVTVLVDAGVGAPGTAGATWASRPGRLPLELEEVGVAPAEIEVVVFTHAHPDHIGWALSPSGGTAQPPEPTGPAPTFRNARHLLHRDDVELFPAQGDDEDRAAFEQSIRSLADAGLLDPFDADVHIAGEITVRHAPGHTPGHSVVLLESGEGSLLLGGDLVNHPAQVADPARRSAADSDPLRASATRTEWLDRVAAEGAWLATAHFAAPFGVVGADGAARGWRPLGPNRGG
jgi:glyoxylase-like metal-dependent hydrolase (beta-lactamase superfamily II)